MTISISRPTPRAHRISAELYMTMETISLSSETYVTGGFSYVPKGIQTLKLVLFEQPSVYFYRYDYTNKKVKVFSAINTELTNGTAMTVASIPVVAIGYS